MPAFLERHKWPESATKLRYCHFVRGETTLERTLVTRSIDELSR